jgi:hypothetical protein
MCILHARDIVRGSSPTWVRKVYDFAIKPDATFYFRVPNDIAIERISVGRPPSDCNDLSYSTNTNLPGPDIRQPSTLWTSNRYVNFLSSFIIVISGHIPIIT